MPKYYLNDNEKNIVRLMAHGLQDGSVDSTWIMVTGGDRIVSAFGAGQELGTEIRENRLQQNEFDNLVDCDLLRHTDSNRYSLNKQQIIQAVENDFEEPIDIELVPEQRDLLLKLVEASRSVPRESRRDFFARIVMNRGPVAALPLPGSAGVEIDYLESDLLVLRQNGLLTVVRQEQSSITFNVAPLGYQLYAQIKRRLGQPVKQVVATIRDYLDIDSFRQNHPKSYAKWVDAESRLWGADAETQLTTIGHLCREAMQEFATELVEKYQPPNVSADKAHTKSRVGEVIKLRGTKLGDTEKPFLDALFSYWDQLILIIQRQEHGGQKEGSSLVWEDARRAVFQTAVVMFEIDRALTR